MLEVLPEHLEAIRLHGERDYPFEACGLLIGSLGETKTLREVHPISNAREEAAKRNRFLITPEELMRGERHAEGLELEVIGFYHSHPDVAAVPSGFDRDHAWPTYSYVIVSVCQGRAAEVLSWELALDRTRFDPEAIQGA